MFDVLSEYYKYWQKKMRILLQSAYTHAFYW